MDHAVTLTLESTSLGFMGMIGIDCVKHCAAASYPVSRGTMRSKSPVRNTFLGIACLSDSRH